VACQIGVADVKDERRSRVSIFAAAMRCVRLRCPVCGDASLVRAPFHIRHHCPACAALFKREDGFFVGALAINVVTTEVVLLVFYFIYLLLTDEPGRLLIPALIVASFLFPALFYHHSWSIWLTLDHLIEKLPQHVDDAERSR
jgi:uncharacterized protein (DUF983 family)